MNVLMLRPSACKGQVGQQGSLFLYLGGVQRKFQSSPRQRAYRLETTLLFPNKRAQRQYSALHWQKFNSRTERMAWDGWDGLLGNQRHLTLLAVYCLIYSHPTVKSTCIITYIMRQIDISLYTITISCDNDIMQIDDESSGRPLQEHQLKWQSNHQFQHPQKHRRITSSIRI